MLCTQLLCSAAAESPCSLPACTATCGTSEEMLAHGEALLKRAGPAEPGFGAPRGRSQGMMSAATAAVLVALVLC